MTDPLVSWWVHELQVERRTGPGAYGDKFATAETVTGFFSDGTQLVGGPDGAQIASTGRFAFPADVAYIPVESRVTLPALFGGRVCTVVASAVADGGGQPTPDHQTITVR